MVTDNEGNTFSTYNNLAAHYGFTSFSEMAEAHDIPPHVLRARISRYHMPLTEAIHMEYKPAKPCVDHLGNKFDSEFHMARHYGQKYECLMSRLQKGMSLEEALTIKPKKGRWLTITDHKGNVFRSIRDLADYYGLSRTLVQSRYQQGLPIEKILHKGKLKTCQGNPVKDHYGNKFESFEAMARYYEIPPTTLKRYIQQKGSVAKALKALLPKHDHITTDHLGHTFASVEDMSKYYNLSYLYVYNELKRGNTFQDILENMPYDNTGHYFKERSVFCPHLKVIRGIQNGFYEIEYLNENMVFHMDQMLALYRKSMLLNKGKDLIIK
jgi:hypothetical protein